MKRILLILAVLLCAGSAQAVIETCQVDVAAFQQWTLVTSNISSTCTEDAADNFVIGDGFTLQLEADITLTTGSIEIQTGGTLIVPPGWTLNPGSMLWVNGGTLKANGEVLAKGYIDEPPTIGATSNTISTSMDVSGWATTDSLVFLDEDPPPGQPVSGCVFSGSGRPVDSSCHRPAYEKWRWYDITALGTGATADELTYIMTDVAYDAANAATAEPYKGTRTNDTSVTLTSQTLQRYGFATAIVTDIGTAGIDGDFGDSYLYFVEATGADADPDECSGESYKIEYIEEAGASADTLYVLGDTTHCNPTTLPMITRGVRRGDPVAIVRPATIDFDNLAILMWENGNIEASWFRFINLGAADRDCTNLFDNQLGGAQTTGSPDSYCDSDGATVAYQRVAGQTNRMECNICIKETASGDGPDGGYLIDGDIGGPNEGALDTGIINPSSQNISKLPHYGTGTAPVTAASILNLNGIKFRRLYIHDTMDDKIDGSGSHGIWADTVKGLKYEEIRVERITDDGIGARQGVWGLDLEPSIVGNSLIVQAVISTNDNSQQCISYGPDGYGAGATYNGLLVAGSVKLTDVVMGGCADANSQTSMAGSTINRFLMGGSHLDNTTDKFFSWANPTGKGSSCDAANSPTSCCTAAQTGATCVPSVNLVEAAPQVVSNGLMPHYGVNRAANVNCGPDISGHFLHSVLWGSDMLDCSGAAGFAIQFVSKFDGVFADMNDGMTTSGMLKGISQTVAVPELDFTTLWLEDTVLIGDDANRIGTQFCYGMTKLEVRRLVTQYEDYTTEGPWRSLGVGAMGGGAGCLAPTTINIVGHIAGITDIESSNYDIADETGVVQDVCFATTNIDKATDMPPLATNFEWRSEVIHPTADEDSTLRRYIQQPDITAPCNKALPLHLGLAEVGTSHIMGGDGFIKSIETYSSEDLIHASGPGSGTGTRGF